MQQLFSILAKIFKALADLGSGDVVEFAYHEIGNGVMEGRMLTDSRRIVTRRVTEPFVFGGATYEPGVYEAEQAYDDELSYVNAPLGIGGGHHKRGWRASKILNQH